MNNAELAAKIAGDLFGGNNDHAPKAGHLRLYTAIGDEGRYMAGWSENPMATRIEALLDEAGATPYVEVAAALSALRLEMELSAGELRETEHWKTRLSDVIASMNLPSATPKISRRDDVLAAVAAKAAIEDCLVNGEWSDQEFDRKIQQLRNDGDDNFADAIDRPRAEITAERQASKQVVAGGLEFRNHIAALLPESWYTALPVEGRIRLLVEQWRKLHVSHVELTAERDGLRKQFHTQAEQRDFVGRLVDNMPHAQIAAEFKEFKAEVADALTTMEHALRPDLFRPGFYEAAMEIIGVTREQLGIAPGKDGVNG